MKNLIVYSIENIVDNKKYIGQTIRGTKRWNDHRNNLNKNKHENQYLQNAWNFYGENNFIFEILKSCNNEEELCYWENYYIVKFKTRIDWGNGYNCDEGGKGGPNPSPETREKMSKKKQGKAPWNKGIKLNEDDLEYRIKLSESHMGKQSGMKGKKHTEESRMKMSESNMGRESGNKGKKMSQESRTKLSESKKGKPSSLKGIPASEESKRKNSESHKGLPSPRKGARLSEDTKQKLSDAKSGKQNGKSDKTSNKYLGVSYHEKTNKWAANVFYKGENIYLGIFDFEVEAAKAVNDALLDLYGFKAKLNQIPESELLSLWSDCTDPTNELP
jgi:group I intron endonuclease